MSVAALRLAVFALFASIIVMRQSLCLLCLASVLVIVLAGTPWVMEAGLRGNGGDLPAAC
ncbi:hypothetical protein [Mycolicibacterium pyrenivorans]|uniref:hypothetical protein n=1 Tax=Mycolicibacterium pyrenivorans TaxID=187102 RepID=UPI0021F34367|nr:hypothetical protein [Mycolicibacterium pyrenivorans]MCV7151378.1 hypothetical protein [Mycolicibacterium pyrenivorans]